MRCLKLCRPNARKRVALVNNPIVPGVTIIAVDAAIYPIIFLKIPVAMTVVDARGEKEGKRGVGGGN